MDTIWNVSVVVVAVVAISTLAHSRRKDTGKSFSSSSKNPLTKCVHKINHEFYDNFSSDFCVPDSNLYKQHDMVHLWDGVCTFQCIFLSSIFFSFLFPIFFFLCHRLNGIRSAHAALFLCCIFVFILAIWSFAIKTSLGRWHQPILLFHRPIEHKGHKTVGILPFKYTCIGWWAPPVCPFIWRLTRFCFVFFFSSCCCCDLFRWNIICWSINFLKWVNWNTLIYESIDRLSNLSK